VRIYVDTEISSIGLEETLSRRTPSNEYWLKVLDMDLLWIGKTWHLLIALALGKTLFLLIMFYEQSIVCLVQ
jgi:hypothetical protein